MTAVQTKFKLLEWAIKSRTKNQELSLALLALLQDYETRWKSKKFSRAAQELIAVAFSLWRAAFLADKTSKREDVFAHGKAFLERVIEDNSISYPQDKTAREWTFNYYTRNARYALKYLANRWPDEVPPYEDGTRMPMERWDYCDSLFAVAVANFRKRFVAEEAQTRNDRRLNSARAERRKKRSKIRQWTLEKRKSGVQ